jgi:topoisomerase-4 subunit A
MREEYEENKDTFEDNNNHDNKDNGSIMHLGGMYENWFLDYASYVILERAVPDIRDGLKPVHRRILHAMKEMDDGRFSKVANIIGQTMKYHPHGDASIGDALVQLGQKDLLIETQGNWGNTFTGDSAAAPRYIEARLSQFAREVVFNPKTTEWQISYDGRSREPFFLPAKFPLLLVHGVEGIAVGLASKILPHNFIELIDASVGYLKGEEPNIFPDFHTGGSADFSKYNQGLRGGRVRIRAKIEKLDKKSLAIKEIPFSTTTSSVIDSIINANDKGKIKIKKIEDNTAGEVEIVVHLVQGSSPDQMIDALYAFTDCEVSISPNACVIDGDKPRFINVNEILKTSTDNTLALLKKELQIKKAELMEQWLFSSLEKIFIEERIYRHIENCETWEEILQTIDKQLEPFKEQFYRKITKDDIIKLTEIKIKRISKYDSFKADRLIKGIEEELKSVNYNLDNLVAFAIKYFKNLKKKYGKGKERRTEIRSFDTIEATQVAANNVKLYANREEGFAGYNMKNDEFICNCSDIDEIITFREDGTFVVTKIDEKAFVGKNIIHIDIFRRNDDRTIYNMLYRDGLRGNTHMKRFAVTSVMRDKEYDLTKGTEGSKVLYFTANPNGEAEIITIYLRHKPRLKKLRFDVDFSELAIKGRNSIGNIVTKHPIRKIKLKESGESTLGGINIWFDKETKRLNSDEKGKFLGSFLTGDKVFTLMQSGHYKLSDFDYSTHFEEDLLEIEKYNPSRIITAIYLDPESKKHYIKRFIPEATESLTSFIDEEEGAKLVSYSIDKFPMLSVQYKAGNRTQITEEEFDVAEFIAIKGVKAKGKRISQKEIEKIEWLEPKPDNQATDIKEKKDKGTNAPKPFTSEEEEQQTSLFNFNNGDD